MLLALQLLNLLESGGASDTTPDAFSGQTLTGQAESAAIEFDPVTPIGYDAATSIAISGDVSSEYSINGGVATSSPGTLSPGDYFEVFHTSGGDYSVVVDSIITLDGTVSATFRSVTAADPAIVATGNRKINFGFGFGF